MKLDWQSVYMYIILGLSKTGNSLKKIFITLQVEDTHDILNFWYNLGRTQ